MKIAISGYYGFNNTGDEAILEALRLGIRQNLPNSDMKVLDAKNRFNLKLIWDCDIFISGGGGLLQDKTSTRSFLYYLGLIKLAKMLGKKVFVFAASLGPVTKPDNRFLLKRVLNRVDLITVRDQHSFNFVKSLHLKNPRVVETADPALLLKPVASQTIKAPALGVCVRKLKDSRKLAEVLDKLSRDLKLRVVFIPFQPDRDIPAAQEVIRHMREPAELIQAPLKPREILGIIFQLDLLIGMRLHSLIFAVSSLVPAVGLSYDPKVASFLDEVNLPYLPADAFDAEELLSLVKQLWDNREGVKRSLAEARRKLYGKAQLNFGMINMLRGSSSRE